MWLRLSPSPSWDQIVLFSAWRAVDPQAAPPQVCLMLCHLALTHLGEDGRSQTAVNLAVCSQVFAVSEGRGELLSGETYSSVAEAAALWPCPSPGSAKILPETRGPGGAWLHTLLCNSKEMSKENSGHWSLSPSCFCVCRAGDWGRAQTTR